MSIYKPLTPKFREDIRYEFNKQIDELRSCKQNDLVKFQIGVLIAERDLICSLPDGYPIPLKGEEK